MISIEQPMAEVLESFCHIEWWEVDELAELIRSGAAKFDVGALRTQLEKYISNPQGLAAPVNELTLNEFETDEDAHKWLVGIYQRVFSGDQAPTLSAR